MNDHAIARGTGGHACFTLSRDRQCATGFTAPVGHTTPLHHFTPSISSKVPILSHSALGTTTYRLPLMFTRVATTSWGLSIPRHNKLETRAILDVLLIPFRRQIDGIDWLPRTYGAGRVPHSIPERGRGNVSIRVSATLFSVQRRFNTHTWPN
jgi:hypothetical protein